MFWQFLEATRWTLDVSRWKEYFEKLTLLFQFSLQTSHNYELTLVNHTLIEQCQDRTSTDIPSIEYKFIKIKDIQDISDKEKIDVIGLVTNVDACVNQSLKSGRETKKREITIRDDSGAEIMMTLWGDNAEKYDQGNLNGKVLAARSVMVSDWNGKSLSCTFGSSLEINPQIAQAEQVLSCGTQDLTSLSSQRARPNVEAQFACLKQIQDEFQDGTVQTKYYNLYAHLTDIKADKIMYKACPNDKCNKAVTDMTNGVYKCEKCRQDLTSFNWRYILRGAIADPTGYQVTISKKLYSKKWVGFYEQISIAIKSWICRFV